MQIIPDPRSGGLLTAGNHARPRTREKTTNRLGRRRGRKSTRNIVRRLLTRRDVGGVILFDMIPDEVLLAIFDFCVDPDVDGDQLSKKGIEAWQTLVHVCRRWRCIVFGSPRRLNLRLACTTKTPARETLGVWPALPLLIQDSAPLIEGFDSIISLLEHSDRVCQIKLKAIPGRFLEKGSTVMQQPFPELTLLLLESFGETVPVLPDSFLGGSTPSLRFLQLSCIPFPGLPKLLLSATRLVHLHLLNIPHSGYISPHGMVSALSSLTSLGSLCLEFQSPRSRPVRESQRPPPPTRSVFRSLTYFWFKGVSEYLDEFVARINAPRLKYLDVTFFNQIDFDTPQFIQFISRTPKLKAFNKARAAFKEGVAEVKLSSGHGKLNVKISCRAFDWQVSSLEQVCTSSLPPLSMLEDLYLFKHPCLEQGQKDDIENTLWLGLLRPFSGVRNLYLSSEFVPRIVLALQDLIGDRTTVVLPTLEKIFLEDPPPGPSREDLTLKPEWRDIGRLVAALQVTRPSIAVYRWKHGEDTTFQGKKSLFHGEESIFEGEES